MSSLPPTFLPGWHIEDKVRQVDYRKLGNTDLMVSPMGIGGCVVGGLYPDQATEHEVFQAIETAIKSGLNYIDTAPFYGEGKSEQVFGRVLRKIPRHTYYIGTKVGRYAADWKRAFDFSADRVMKEFDASLKRLQLPSVDIVQIHDFEFCQDSNKISNETLEAVRRIQESGKARYIGITGYPLDDFHAVLDTTHVKVDTVLSYCRNLLTDSLLKDHAQYFLDKGLGIINASPTGMGLLTNSGPPEWHPATDKLKAICAKAGKYCKDRNVELGKLSVYHNIQPKYISITLLGFSNMKILNINLDILQNGLTPHETQVYEEVKEKFFKDIPDDVINWEGVEMERYNEAVREQAIDLASLRAALPGRRF